MTSTHRILTTMAILLSSTGTPRVSAAVLQLRTQELPTAALGAGYDAKIEVVVDGSCPRGDVGFFLVAGTLPAGVELYNDGLHGVAREIGTFRFRIRAANACLTVQKDYAIVVTGKPILRTAPEELVFACRVGGPDPRPQAILVSSSWPNLAYSVTSEAADWLMVSVAKGVTPDRTAALSSDSVWVRVVAGKLPRGTYKCALRFSAWQGANAPVVPITLNVH